MVDSGAEANTIAGSGVEQCLFLVKQTVEQSAG